MLREFISKFRRFLTFSIVGIVNTLVDMACFALAFSLIGWPDEISQIIGYCCGLICSFLLNRRFTFHDGQRRLWGQIFLFILVNLVSMGISVVLIDLITGWLELLAHLPLLGWLVRTTLHVYAAKCFVTVAVMLINYFGYKYIVFRVDEKGRN